MPTYNIIENCANCSCGWKNFRHLSKKEMQLINENRFEAFFKPGQILIKQGSPASNALFLAGGLAKVYMEGTKGRDFIMSIARPGRMLMGPGAYTTLRHTYTVSALTSVNACFINFDVLRHLVKTNGSFADGMMEDLSEKALISHDKMMSLAQKKMHGRMSEALLYFSNEIFNADEFELLLSRREIGEMTNMAKESVVRILKELSESGIIKYTASKMKILDKKKLINIAAKG